MIILFLTTVLAADVLHLRVDAEPVSLHLAATALHAGFVPPTHGGTITRTGTAFPVDGGFLTVAHLVVGARKIRVEGLPDWRLELVAIDPVHDLALLRGPPTEPYPLATTAPVGTPITLIGFPNDTVRTEVRGTLTDPLPWSFAGPPRLYAATDAVIAVGVSGAPALNPAGEVVGVALAGSTPESPLRGQSLLVPLDAIHRLLDTTATTTPWARSR